MPGNRSVSLTQQEDKVTYRMLFYNAGNFFDIYNDTLKEDDDFTPGGVMRWNYQRYRQKINSVYKVITASGGWEPPDIVGLCEVENRNVLEDLVSDSYLSKYNYGIVHYESADPRGIDLAVLYRKETVKLISSAAMVPGILSTTFRTRYVLYTKLLLAGDTINLFLNHWPSRRGGVLQGEEMRKAIAMMLRTRADSIQKSGSGVTKIIIAGDFNCTPDDSEMGVLTGAAEHDPANDKLVNLSANLKGEINGTYKYRGSWEMLDQIIVSRDLLSPQKGLYTSEKMAGIFCPEFLLKKDNAFAGVTPFGTYTGYRYSGGFSDHLPVYLDLSLTQK